MNKVKQLNEMLMDSLIRDLKDPDKCTPGLYTVVRGIVNDNREAAEGIPADALNKVQEAMASSAPFKIKEATY